MIWKMKNILFRILYILVIIYLIVFIPVFWGYKPLVVVSGSMQPTFKVGSIIYYHKNEIKEFQKGDILVYQIPKHIISHRIVSVNENGFITKGDKNKSNDSKLVYYNQVLGKGTNWCIEYLGYYADYIYHHKYLLFISVALLLIDICNDLYTIRKKKVGQIYEMSS